MPQHLKCVIDVDRQICGVQNFRYLHTVYCNGEFQVTWILKDFYVKICKSHSKYGTFHVRWDQ